MSNDMNSILTSLNKGVATVTLNRPERHNAFDDLLIKELSNTLLRLQSDPAVTLVLLTGSGRSFSAGADLNWMQRMSGYSREQNRSDAMAMATLMATLDGLNKPTVAKVQGAALGGGVGLVACCDIAIASESAQFCLSEVRLGLIPASIAPYVVRAMGERQARRYAVSAERFDGHEARRIGLVHDAVPPEQLDARTESMLDHLRQNGPRAMAASKNMALLAARSLLDEHLIEETANRVADIRASDEGREGITAFLEKRTPSWANPKS